jgi:hypothetical protein
MSHIVLYMNHAIRARVADARPKDSPSLAMQAICKLLEEPDMHYRGIGRDAHVRFLEETKRTKAREAGPEVVKVMLACL